MDDVRNGYAICIPLLTLSFVFLFFQVVGHVPLLTWIHTRVACCASAIVHKTFLFSSFFFYLYLMDLMDLNIKIL